jgi:hypothetical protein
MTDTTLRKLISDLSVRAGTALLWDVVSRRTKEQLALAEERIRRKRNEPPKKAYS